MTSQLLQAGSCDNTCALGMLTTILSAGWTAKEDGREENHTTPMYMITTDLTFHIC